MIDPRLDPHMDPARFNDAMREYQAYVAGKTRPMDPYLDPHGTPSTFGDQMSTYIGSYGMDPQATTYQQLPFESWGALFPNYAGAGVYSGPILDKFAPKFGTRGEAQQWLNQFYTDDGKQDPLWDYRLAQRIAGATGAINNPQVQQWLTQAGQHAQQATDTEHQRDRAGKTSIGDVAKGAMFAIGTPLTLGGALTGVPMATALGGGLGADILGAIVNPAGSMGMSGLPASLVNTGIKQGIGSLLEPDGSRSVRLQPPSGAISGATSGSTSATNAGPTEAVSSFAQDVLTPQTGQTPGRQMPTESLSNQVMTITKPRRPQIRLTPGFRRGQ